MRKIIPILFVMVLMTMIVYSLVTVKYDSPIDEFYLIKDGAVMGNISFSANATPSGSTGVIMNISLYHNISGTWGVNYTNDTTATISTETNRIFSNPETSINSGDLSDGLVFIWNAYACDNISSFYNEDISLNSDVFTIFDNYTNLTGDGLCVAAENYTNCIIITAGRGRVANYPVSTLDQVMNTTAEDISTGCKLNGSTDGFFYCNQTLETYNSSGILLSTEALSTSSVKANYTISSTCRFIDTNRTVYVEEAPLVTIDNPADNSYSASTTVTIGLNVTGDSSTYSCHIYSNDTTNWIIDGGTTTFTDNIRKNTSREFNEGNIVWNSRCNEVSNSNIYGWATANRTIIVDTTNPAITINSPVTDTYVKYIRATDGYAVKINVTVVDNNPDSCTIKINGTTNRSSVYTNGDHFDLNFNASDGNYNWNINCTDDAGRRTETANRTVTSDTIIPTLTANTNYSSTAADCEGFTVDFTFSEIVNATFTWGTSTMAQTHSLTETDFATNQTFTLTFNNTYETNYFVNVSVDDRAENRNNSLPEMTIPSPIPLCTGWSLWSVYETISLLEYRTASGADYVYYWNNTGQGWIYSAAAGSLREDHDLKIGDVVQLYESTNTTYFRNNTGNPQYYINITGGHVYFGLYNAYKFGNISYNLFLNESGSNVTDNRSDYLGTPQAGGLEFRIDYLSSFNNSNQQYTDSIYTWSWNNDTILGKGYQNGLDTLWSFVDYNLTINFTAGGEVIGNWT